MYSIETLMYVNCKLKSEFLSKRKLPLNCTVYILTLYLYMLILLINTETVCMINVMNNARQHKALKFRNSIVLVTVVVLFILRKSLDITCRKNILNDFASYEKLIMIYLIYNLVVELIMLSL